MDSIITISYYSALRSVVTDYLLYKRLQKSDPVIVISKGKFEYKALGDTLTSDIIVIRLDVSDIARYERTIFTDIDSSVRLVGQTLMPLAMESLVHHACDKKSDDDYSSDLIDIDLIFTGRRTSIDRTNDGRGPPVNEIGKFILDAHAAFTKVKSILEKVEGIPTKDQESAMRTIGSDYFLKVSISDCTYDAVLNKPRSGKFNIIIDHEVLSGYYSYDENGTRIVSYTPYGGYRFSELEWSLSHDQRIVDTVRWLVAGKGAPAIDHFGWRYIRKD